MSSSIMTSTQATPPLQFSTPDDTPSISDVQQYKSNTGFSMGQDQHSDDEQSFLDQFVAFAQTDDARNNLIHELIIQYGLLQRENARLKREQGGSHEGGWSYQKQQYEHAFQQTNRAMTHSPFVMILINGNSMLFRDQYLQGGEGGGRVVAAQLQNAILRYLENKIETIATGPHVLCRIYADIRGLSDALARDGVVARASAVDAFFRGFTRGKTLFDVIDVGPGQKCASEKIAGSFELYKDNLHCQRIFLGGLPDEFVRALDEYMNEPVHIGKVTLLEARALDKQRQHLPCRKMDVSTIFRYSRVHGIGAVWSRQSKTPGSGSLAVMDSPMIPRMAMNLPRTPSSSTLASDGMLMHPKPAMTWAAKAATPPIVLEKSLRVAEKPMTSESSISRNRAGQRIDPRDGVYDKTEVDQLKKMKLCNLHFLAGKCFKKICPHDHKYALSQREVPILKLIARLSYCQNGTGCADATCIYGHECQAPTDKTRRTLTSYSNSDKKKFCIFGEGCKFPLELHDIDRRAIRVLVVR